LFAGAFFTAGDNGPTRRQPRVLARLRPNREPDWPRDRNLLEPGLRPGGRWIGTPRDSQFWSN